jgi:peptide deformylase
MVAGWSAKFFCWAIPRLYEVSAPSGGTSWRRCARWRTDLRDTLHAFQRKYGVGRAIAAPQIGVGKR